MTETTATIGNATGPQTPEGKSRSSRNATKIGLYTARDFIREGEEDEYISGFNDLMAELDPQTPLEKVFATEIMSANWRLRRCRIIEAGLALEPEPGANDAANEEKTNEQKTNGEKTQRSVDRARAQSHVILRRSLSELRKLQTERAIRIHIKLPGIPGVAETARVLDAMNSAPEDSDPANLPAAGANPRIGLQDLEALMAQADKHLCEQIRADSASPFCKTAASAASTTENRSRNTPRNAPCPCRSGRKYKKCCGSPAQEMSKIAA